MKQNKASRIFSIIFIIIIFAFFVSIMTTFFLRHNETYLSKHSEEILTAAETEDSAQPSGIWEQVYPFSPEYVFEIPDSGEAETTTDKNFDGRYLTAVNTVKNKIEYYATDLLPGRIKFVEANALINKAIGMKLITGTDAVAVMDNGYLTYESYGMNMSNTAESLSWFNSQLNKKGIDFLYVQCPSKENKFDCRLPDGMTDYNNINADSLINILNNKGVPNLDLRPLLDSEADDYYSCFFKTDHHWKPETGVWAAGKIAEKLNSDFGCSIDTSIGNIDNYNIKVYEDYCFGSQGKKVSLTFADPEDISLVTPKAKTDFTVSYCGTNKLSGTFADTMINSSVFDKIDYYNTSTYSAYSYGMQAVKSSHNNNVSDGERVLLIGDSFSYVVFPYLAMGVEYLDALDLRCFDGSVMAYIDEFKPDKVIVCYNPSMFSENVSLSSVYNFQ